MIALTLVQLDKPDGLMVDQRKCRSSLEVYHMKSWLVKAIQAGLHHDHVLGRVSCSHWLLEPLEHHRGARARVCGDDRQVFLCFVLGSVQHEEVAEVGWFAFSLICKYLFQGRLGGFSFEQAQLVFLESVIHLPLV